MYIRGPQPQVRDFATVGSYKPKSYKPGDWNELDILVKSNAESGKFEFRRIRLKEMP